MNAALNALPAMAHERSQIEAAVIAFLVTASGISVLQIGSAFWGLAAGLAFHGLASMARRN